jgi:hypothetical protein
MDKIRQVESTGIFVRDNLGYKINNPDGFVAIGHSNGIINLVTKIEYNER